MTRWLSIAMLAALIVLFTSCGGNTTHSASSAKDAAPSVFSISPAQMAALDAQPDPDWTTDPLVPTAATLMSIPPTPPVSGALLTAPPLSGKTASVAGNGYYCGGCWYPSYWSCYPYELCCQTERFWDITDCDSGFCDVTYKSCLHFYSCYCFSKAGITINFYRDGVLVGSGITDATGCATYTEKHVAIGSYLITSSYGCNCLTCSIRIVVHNECRLHACVVGHGSICGVCAPTMDFKFQIHEDQKNLVEYWEYSLSDGPNINYDDAKPTFLIAEGKEIWFGDGDVLVRAIDNHLGSHQSEDYIEVWITSKGYHNAGFLKAGRVKTSFGWWKPLPGWVHLPFFP